MFRLDFFTWYTDGFVVSLLAFIPVFLFDRELRPNLALHHFPEVFVILFFGSVIGGIFSSWSFFAVFSVFCFLLFLDTMVVSVSLNKKQIQWGTVFLFVTVFTLILDLGVALGMVVPT